MRTRPRSSPCSTTPATRSPRATEPHWIAWRHALTARRALIESDPEAAVVDVAAAREALDKCEPSADTALAHGLPRPRRGARRPLRRRDAPGRRREPAHRRARRPASPPAPCFRLTAGSRWLSPASTWRSWRSPTRCAGSTSPRPCASRPTSGGCGCCRPSSTPNWPRRCAGAATSSARGSSRSRRSPAARAARELSWEPEDDEADLLDVVQAWALTCADDLDGALGPLRRVRRRVEAEGSLWLRAYTGLALARLLVRLAERDDDTESGEEAIGLLVDAAGAFAAAGDRRRYRQCLLELGQNSADLGRPAEALHWLEAYRADTGRAHSRSREMWAEMFVQRSRLREAERQAVLLRRHALEDPLTGLGNRRSAERRLGAMRLGEEPLSLAVVDVDRFKEVNDGTSHTHGDAVLRRVADLLREHSRTGDEVYRWAGDEFLVVLPTATQAQAVVVMERLRSAVAAADWTDLEVHEPVTVSVGVATAPAVDGDAVSVGWRALFDTADLHLFSAKRGGRNRVRAPGAAQSPEPEGDETGDDDAPDGADA